MHIIFDVFIVILAVDFASGLLHWLEDSYGKPEWPLTGALITAPNILHHRHPTAFTKNSWLKSAKVLLALGVITLAAAWVTGVLTWQVLLFVGIGVNANEIHKWNHLPRNQRGKLVVILQRYRLLQTPQHHGRHHAGSKDTYYCVITNTLNPVLEVLEFWRRLESIIECIFGMTKRPDTSAIKTRPLRAHYPRRSHERF